MSSEDTVAIHGWTAVPRDAKVLLGGKPYINKPYSLLAKDIKFPSDDLVVAKVREYAQEKLSPPCFNHSMRVYYFSMAILTQQFPSHAATLSPSTLALTCLLHDIGTTPTRLRATQLSFEYYGGILALNLLRQDLHASQSQAEAVAEAIFRHQDVGTTGTLTFLGQLIQLGTLYDNTGGNPEIVHEDTRDDVNREFPRMGWSRCFAEVIGEELGLKPWAHTSHLGEEEFPAAVLGNKLMEEYE
ncbi:urea hydro-lyase cyanamide [Coniochaeta ligniaria NRRL 30616]|uniref:Urea hydro-lyase cyanamide n=1 Tax=Coniochaeta ligniaria NRRL 30616 TaxID=1408157 RepID=A0A1J7IMD0_9PEZI|nr:urea hydro-lyase cyanamide [Coniochaeta ligniaria NRRL 30616]